MSFPKRGRTKFPPPSVIQTQPEIGDSCLLYAAFDSDCIIAGMDKRGMCSPCAAARILEGEEMTDKGHETAFDVVFEALREFEGAKWTEGPRSFAADVARKAAARLAGWQPINTATVVNDALGSPLECLLYSPEFGVKIGTARRFADGEVFARAVGFDGEMYSGRRWKITHWMPLPAPPKDDR